jgi:adenine-specific DNA-methyltransferase
VQSNFLEQVESSRVAAQKQITDEKQKLSEQYFTPSRVSKIMAEMFSVRTSVPPTSILDPCCGVGNLAAAALSRALSLGESVNLTLIEKDHELLNIASDNFSNFKNVKLLSGDFFSHVKSISARYDRIILNPPYSKISADSTAARVTRDIVGHNETNIYSAFMACCLKLLSDNGEMVALIPRSFCNGTMFRNFRRFISSKFSIDEIYLFETRKIFAESDVLQEVLIIKISLARKSTVRISHEDSRGHVKTKIFSIDKVCFVSDENKIIHIPTEDEDDALLEKMAKFTQTLLSSGCRASTGKVVDFRVTRWLRKRESVNSVKLLYQEAVNANSFVNTSKSNAAQSPYIKVTNETKNLLIKRGNYVLVRRMSFKEAPHRIICGPLLEQQFDRDLIGVENHLNYIWGESAELSEGLCVGLAAFLSTPSVDSYIRRFSGHTQINAADLNMLPIPQLVDLEAFGRKLRYDQYSAAYRIAERVFFSD